MNLVLLPSDTPFLLSERELEEAWSDAARKAAALARRTRHSLRSLEQRRHSATSRMLDRIVQNDLMHRPRMDSLSKELWKQTFDLSGSIEALKRQRQQQRSRPLARRVARFFRRNFRIS